MSGRIAESNPREKALADRNTIIESVPFKVFARLPLDSSEGFLLSRLDHPMSIGELLRNSGMPEATVFPVLLSLVTKGLLFLRGHGFDPDKPENNEVVLARWDAGADCAIAADVGDAEVECARARIFWATEGLVIAEVPRVTPGGAVQVRYKNLAFDAIAEEARRWEQAGADLATFYGASGASASGGAPADSASLSAPAVGVVRDRDVPDFTTIWRDPGILRSVTRTALELTLEADGRLCYRDGLAGVADAQKVLVDGYVFSGTALSCMPLKGPNFLRVKIDNQVLENTNLHGVQVVNPFFQTPVAWVR